MNNPQFYIFGVPDGFDIYNATPEKKKFFLSFYDGKYTDRSLMMVIFRNEDNNEVTYVYFRGNILAANGRPGSFLGMALTFQNGLYCTNAKLVHDLFEGMYIAVSNNKLLTTNVTNSQCQAQFLINKFVEQTSNIAALEQWVARQVAGWPAGSLDQIDSTFSSDPRSIELDMRNISWEHVIPNMKAVSWVYLTGLTADVPPVQQTQPQPVHDAESVNEVANKPNNQWPSNGGRTQSQPVSQKRETTSTSSHTESYEQSYEQRLKRLVSDVQFELGTNYNNGIKSLQQRVRIMNTLKERVQKLNRERPNDKSLDKEREKIENEINNLNARIAAAEKRKRILILALLAIVALIILVVSLKRCSDKTPPTEPDPKSQYKEIVEGYNKEINEKKGWLDTIQSQLSEQADYKNSNNALVNARKYLSQVEEDLKKNRIGKEAFEDRFKKVDSCLNEFDDYWEKVQKEPAPVEKEEPRTNEGNKPASAENKKNNVKENNNEGQFSDKKWSWKVEVKGRNADWSKNEIPIQSGVHITITVYNNGVETPVMWSWSPSIRIHRSDVRNQTELKSIEISRSSEGTGVITFWPRSNPSEKYSIRLKPE